MITDFADFSRERFFSTFIQQITVAVFLSDVSVFSVQSLDLLHDGTDQLLGVLAGAEVQGVVIVEGGVAGDEHEAGPQHPEHEARGAGEQEEGDGADADTQVLLGQAHLVTCDGEFSLCILEAGDVSSAPGGGEDDDEEGGGDEAVEHQHQEHRHVVGLEVVNILVQPLGQPPGTRGNLEIRCVEKCPYRPDVCPPLAEPLLDGGLRDADGDRQTHLSSEQRLGGLALADLLGTVVKFTTQFNSYLRVFRFT